MLDVCDDADDLVPVRLVAAERDTRLPIGVSSGQCLRASASLTTATRGALSRSRSVNSRPLTTGIRMVCEVAVGHDPQLLLRLIFGPLRLASLDVERAAAADAAERQRVGRRHRLRRPGRARSAAKSVVEKAIALLERGVARLGQRQPQRQHAARRRSPARRSARARSCAPAGRRRPAARATAPPRRRRAAGRRGRASRARRCGRLPSARR